MTCIMKVCIDNFGEGFIRIKDINDPKNNFFINTIDRHAEIEYNNRMEMYRILMDGGVKIYILDINAD